MRGALSVYIVNMVDFKNKNTYRIMFYLLSVGIILLFQISCDADQIIDQPIAYNHSIHINDVGMECDECHTGVENRARATLPSIEVCEDCHSEMNGETNAEAFVVEAIENNKEINWNRVYNLPDHVFFSHRRHVSLGKIECTQCHGAIQDFESPPKIPHIELTMDFCMDCHEEHKVNNDCLACHR